MKKKKKVRARKKQRHSVAVKREIESHDFHLRKLIAQAEQHAHQGDISSAAEMALKGLETFPDSPDMLATAGYVHEMAGRFSDARQCHEAALSINPESRHALFHFSKFLIRRGQWKESATYLETLLKLEPENHWVYLALGTACMYQKNLDRARELIEKSISLNGNDERAWVNLGNTLRFMRNFVEAERALKKALDMQVNQDVLVALSSLYTDMGDCHKGIYYAELALNLGQQLTAETLKSIAYPHMKAGRYDDAEKLYRRALEIDPAHADAGFGLAISLLLQGRLEEGWPLYRARFDVMQTWLEGHWPEWNGEDLTGKVLYVCAEQGLGDTLQFVRFIPVLKEMGINVVFSFQPVLARLLKCLEEHAVLLPHKVVDLQMINADFQTALLELPSRLGINEISQIPDTCPYLSVSDDIVQYWRSLTAGFEPDLKVGLVWAGNPNHVNDHNRSIRLSMLNRLGKIPGIRLFSLQIGSASSEIETCRNELDVVDLTDKIKDFADTAGLIENLDIVVSVDTATAHLAGALGKPVIILLPYSPDWRWFLERNDSPWYPTARLLRQPDPGNWEPVIEQLVEILLNWGK